MALEKSFVTQSGLSVADAYWRVEHVIYQSGKEDSGFLFVIIRAYRDQDAFSLGLPPVDELRFSDIPFDKQADVSMHAQVYNAIKARAELAGSVDK